MKRLVRWVRPNRMSIVYGSFLVLLSVLYCGSYFQSLEEHHDYHGNVYQALHLESFPDDPYMSLTRPMMLSSYYFVARVAGDVWLDDRFGLGVYFVLVLLALVGLDRIAQAMGVNTKTERIIVLSVLIIPHPLLNNIASVVKPALDGTSFGGVIGIWLLYYLLRSGPVAVVLGLNVLLMSFSIKSAWFLALLSAVMICKSIESPKKQHFGAIAVLVVVGMAAVVGYVVAAVPGVVNPELFDYIVAREAGEANPFDNRYMSFIALSIVCLLTGHKNDRVSGNIRLVVFSGLVLWALGGLYLTFAPNALKVPYLVPFAPTRALWWPQLIAYTAIMSSVLAWIRGRATWGRVLGGGAALLLLQSLPLGNSPTGAAAEGVFLILIVATGVTLLAYFTFFSGSGQDVSSGDGENEVEGWFAAGGYRYVVTWCVVVIAVGALWEKTSVRVPALRAMLAQGVLGDNAQWLGVSEFLVSETPASATALAFKRVENANWMEHDTALKIRAGRSMPVGSEYAILFDYEGLQQLAYRKRLAEEIPAHVGRAYFRDNVAAVTADAKTIASLLKELGSPDYLIMPSSRLAGPDAPLGKVDTALFGYPVAAEIDGFTILRSVGD